MYVLFFTPKIIWQEIGMTRFKHENGVFGGEECLSENGALILQASL